MERSHDVIVVGAGIIGCAVARELARRGAAVRVFESVAIGSGATWASAGVLAPYIEAHDRGLLLTLAVRSLAMYDRFVQEAVDDSQIAVEYRRCGTLEVAADHAAVERMTAMRSAGEPRILWLDSAAARRREPALRESIGGALFVADHGYVAVPALTDALAWAALRHGVQIEAAHRVTAVGREGSGLAAVTADGAVWPAKTVVVCAGSWSGQLEMAGAPRAAVRPIRGQLLRLTWRSDPLSCVVWGPDCYVVPWTDGTVLVGATVEDVGFDQRTTAAGVKGLLDAVCRLLPAAANATFVEARAGLRPASDDGLPIIGASGRLPGLVYATGHYRNGVLLAPLTARLVADLVIDGNADPILASLRPDR